MRRTNIISKQEAEDLLQMAYPNSKHQALIAFLFIFGCRKGEALMIRKGNLWTEKGYLWALMPVLKRREAYTHRLKINIRNPFVPYILRHWATLGANSFMFPGYKGRPISLRHVNRILKKYDESLYPHLFRHTRATLMAEKGMTESEMQTWFGWKDGRQASVYIKQSVKLIERIADLVD